VGADSETGGVKGLTKDRRQGSNDTWRAGSENQRCDDQKAVSECAFGVNETHSPHPHSLAEDPLAPP
jgi:hypothetical protein